MMGAWRPKHVEKVCSNKICIFVPNMAKWRSTCNHNYLYRWLPFQYFILLMMGAWRPKHVEKVCSNKICILLHHVSVLFNLNFVHFVSTVWVINQQKKKRDEEQTVHGDNMHTYWQGTRACSDLFEITFHHRLDGVEKTVRKIVTKNSNQLQLKWQSSTRTYTNFHTQVTC